MTQINTPYPATAYLTGFLRERGYDVAQADPALELVLRLFSRAGLVEVEAVLKTRRIRPASVKHFLENAKAYQDHVEAVVRFLQKKDATLAYRIATEGYLPAGPRFAALSQLDEGFGDGVQWAFGALGLQDQAQHFASLFIDDIADVIRDGVDPRFELSRYAEKLAASAPSFDPLLAALEAEPTLVDRTLDAITQDLVEKHRPDVVGLTLPFPGNVYGAFRMAKQIRRLSPRTKIVLGGGYVNTELRELSDARVFDYVDYITLDDGGGIL